LALMAGVPRMDRIHPGIVPRAAITEPMTKTFQKMKRQPAADWTIADVQVVCGAYDIEVVPPRGGGSHFKIRHPSQAHILTIPARRPIKVIYIRRLVAFIESVEAQPS